MSAVSDCVETQGKGVSAEERGVQTWIISAQGVRPFLDGDRELVSRRYSRTALHVSILQRYNRR